MNTPSNPNPQKRLSGSPILKWMRSNTKTPVSALMLLCFSSWSVQVQGASDDWNQVAAGTYAWDANGNWLSGAGFPNSISDVATVSLDTSGLQLINLNVPITLGQLTIGDTGGLVRQSMVIAANGGSLILDDNGLPAAVTKVGFGADAITSNVSLAAGTEINVTDGMLALAGVVSGTGGLTKNGAGTLVMRGSNTYTGVTTINNGILLDVPVANDGAVLGATGAGNETIVNAGGTLAFGPDALGAGGIGNPAETVTLNGNGHLGQGAMLFYMGANSMTFNGPVTFGSDTRIQNNALGTLTTSAAITTNNHNLSVGGVSGFISLGGTYDGNGTINKYGTNGFRLTNNASTFSGAIAVDQGELRADTGDTTTGLNPYNSVSAFSVKNGYLDIVMQSTVGGGVQNRIDDDIPISLSAGRIRLESASFNNTTAGQNAVPWNEVVWATVTVPFW
jgi:fibronectin-binding autotransporter adhesin